MGRSYRFGQPIILFYRVDTLRLLKIRITFCSPRGAKKRYQLKSLVKDGGPKCLESLRNDCSTGYDNISVSFTKPIFVYIATSLTFLINSLIEESKFPDQQKIVRISPIPKFANSAELKDYRLISSLSIYQSLRKISFTRNNRLHWNETRIQ